MKNPKTVDGAWKGEIVGSSFLVFLMMVDYLMSMYLEFFVSVWQHIDTISTSSSSLFQYH